MTDTAPPGARLQRVRADRPDVLEALLTAAGDHLEPLLDVGSTAGGDLLLVLPAPAVRLPELLGSPGGLTPGEAVTLLVPLAQCLQRMHDAGVAHGAAAPESVVVDADGCPAWSLTAPPVLLRRAGPAAFAAAAEQDRSRFGAFAVAVVARSGGRPPAVDLPLAGLVDALFDLAEPEPLRLDPAVQPPRGGPPARLVAPREPEPTERAGGLPPRLAALLAPLSAVRRRVWVVTGAVALALLAALALLPATGTADAAGAPAPPASSARASVATPTSSAAVAPRSATAAVALRALIAARAACLLRGDAVCLDRVVAAGSPVRAADRRAIAAGTDAVRVGDARPRVLSDGGGTVVADAGGTVVVAVRQPDGWRLRDVVAEPPG